MDPISIASLAVGLAFKVGSAAVTTQQFMQHVRESRMEMDRVAQELGSLKFALEMLAKDAKTPGVAIPPALENILKNCEEVVTKLECDLEKHNRERLVVKIKYVWAGKESMGDLRNNLAAHRWDALNLAIDLMTVSIVRETRTTVDEIHGDTQEIKEDTQAILEEIAKLQAKLAGVAVGNNGQSEFMLQRYLEQLTDYAPTIVGDDDTWRTDRRLSLDLEVVTEDEASTTRSESPIPKEQEESIHRGVIEGNDSAGPPHGADDTFDSVEPPFHGIDKNFEKVEPPLQAVHKHSNLVEPAPFRAGKAIDWIEPLPDALHEPDEEVEPHPARSKAIDKENQFPSEFARHVHEYEMVPTWQPEATAAGSKAALLVAQSKGKDWWQPTASKDSMRAVDLASQNKNLRPNIHQQNGQRLATARKRSPLSQSRHGKTVSVPQVVHSPPVQSDTSRRRAQQQAPRSRSPSPPDIIFQARATPSKLRQPTSSSNNMQKPGDKMQMEELSFEEPNRAKWGTQVCEAMKRSNRSVAPEDGETYREGVDYVRDEYGFILSCWLSKQPIYYKDLNKILRNSGPARTQLIAEWLKWVRAMTMSGVHIHSPFADYEHLRRNSPLEDRISFRGSYPISYALFIRDETWLDSLLHGGVGLMVRYEYPYPGFFGFIPWDISLLSTALMWNIAVARKLVEAGAKPSDEISWLLSCPWLHNMPDDRLTYSVGFLLESGANPNVNTPIFKAVRRSFKCLQLLLEHGADVSASSPDKGTPLHVALENKSWDSVQLLVKHGAGVHSKAEVRLRCADCAYVNEWHTRGLLGIFSATVDVVEYAAYFGRLDHLNRVLGTEYKGPDSPVVDPGWKKRSKAAIGFRKHVLRIG